MPLFPIFIAMMGAPLPSGMFVPIKPLCLLVSVWYIITKALAHLANSVWYIFSKALARLANSGRLLREENGIFFASVWWRMGLLVYSGDNDGKSMAIQGFSLITCMLNRVDCQESPC